MGCVCPVWQELQAGELQALYERLQTPEDVAELQGQLRQALPKEYRLAS